MTIKTDCRSFFGALQWLVCRQAGNDEWIAWHRLQSAFRVYPKTETLSIVQKVKDCSQHWLDAELNSAWRKGFIDKTLFLNNRNLLCFFSVFCIDFCWKCFCYVYLEYHFVFRFPPIIICKITIYQNRVFSVQTILFPFKRGYFLFKILP